MLNTQLLLPIFPLTYSNKYRTADFYEGMARDHDTKPRPIDARNRVSIPPEVRKALNLETGDYVVFDIQGRRALMRKADWIVKE